MKLKKIFTVFLMIAMLIPAIPAMASYDMPYYIDVDITNQITTIYSTKDGSIVRQMICSSGINGGTPLGVWYMPEKGRASERTAWTWLAEYRCYVKYMTRVHLGYMFHSLPYTNKENETLDPEAVAQLGTAASHGCIRLRVEDAYFIAKNCLVGTRVNFFESGELDEDLRQLLMESSYTNEDGMTYSEFLGYSEDAMGRGSSGTAVSDLQQRMIDLGYYGGEVTGQYDTATTRAVKRVQADLGLPENGITDNSLKDILFSNEAPVAMGNTLLQIGRSGPVVSRLQETLKLLGLYGGQIHGLYDPDVEAAVKLFQEAVGEIADGVARPQLQKIMEYEADLVTKTCGEDFTAKGTSEDVVLAKLSSDTNIIVRAFKDSGSHEVGRLKNGDIVLASDGGEEWAGVVCGDIKGYIRKKYLEPHVQKNVKLTYTGSDGTISIGYTKEEYMNGAVSIARQFESGVPNTRTETKVMYATVNTGADDVTLRMRAVASSDGEVIGEVPNGASFAVIAQEEGFTKVSVNGTEGYLMNDYLNFWEGSADALDTVEDDESSTEDVTAVVVAPSGSVSVYDIGSADANVLGTLNDGTVVNVLDMSGGDYVRISCEGREGYVRETSLRFQLN